MTDAPDHPRPADTEHLADAPSIEQAAMEPVADDSADDEAAPFTVEVVRSTRRRRTVGAQLRGNVLRVSVPGWMSIAEEERWVATMSARFRRRVSASRIDLPSRAAQLARRFDLPAPVSIEWKSNMASRWGSCHVQRRTIGISDRLARFPDWVIDAVIVHELCHLVEHHHGPAFWALAHRYPLMERSIGYLMAKGGDLDTDVD